MRIVKGVVAAAAITLLLVGCSTGGQAGTTAEQPAAQGQAEEPSSTLDAASITDGLESTGLTCTEKDRVLDGREQVIQCKGDDYIVITATRFSSDEERDSQYVRGKKALCENGTAAALRSATSDTWVLVPGGDRDQDVAAFDNAMTTLGLDWREDPCA